MKNISWFRVLCAGFLAEVMPIIFLVLVVIVYSTAIDPGQTEEYYQKFAEEAGFYIGPIVGSLATFLFAWWACRKLQIGFLLNGTLVGVVVAILGITILVASKAPFHIIFVISYTCKIFAGLLGGVVAKNRK